MSARVDEISQLVRFYRACARGDLNSVQHQFESTEININAPASRQDGRTALHAAATGNHVLVLSFLTNKVWVMILAAFC